MCVPQQPYITGTQDVAAQDTSPKPVLPKIGTPVPDAVALAESPMLPRIGKAKK
jgi:hypothetical protein